MTISCRTCEYHEQVDEERGTCHYYPVPNEGMRRIYNTDKEWCGFHEMSLAKINGQRNTTEE